MMSSPPATPPPSPAPGGRGRVAAAATGTSVGSDLSSDSGLFYVGTTDLPDRIGPYRIIDELGEGGFGIVYLAQQDEPVRRRVAVKVVKPGMDSREVLARFGVERQALALMDHPGIARIFDAGMTDGGRPYFAMEYVAGAPLTRYCDEHQLSIRRRLELFEQVCDAVHHAHQKGVIHRDIKPGNILVSDLGGEARVRIIDFGVAKALTQGITDETLHTRQQQMIGTLEYMSPEQAGLGSADVDVRADVYALGVLLYELLAGALPFDRGRWRAATLAEIQEMIRSVDPPKPSRRLTGLGQAATEVARRRSTGIDSLSRELSRELEWIPQMAMRKDRCERYQSVAAMAEDIRNYLEARPLRAHPEGTAYLMRKFVCRHRAGVAMGGVIAGVVLIASVISISFGVVAWERARSADEKAAGMSAIVDVLTESGIAGEGTLRDRLIEVSRTILPRLEDHPEAEADVRLKIGRTLYQLGDLDSSEPHLVRAYELLERIHGPGSVASGEPLLRLGYLRDKQGRFEEAIGYFEQRLAGLAGHPGSPPVFRANAKQGIGMVEVHRGNIDVAEATLREAVDLYRAEGADVESVEALIQLAEIARERREFESARALLERCAEIWRDAFGPDDARLAQIASRLSLVHLQAAENAGGTYDPARLDRAIALAREAENLQAKLDPMSPSVGRTNVTLAQALMAAGRYDEALARVEMALRIYRVRYGDSHSYVAGTLLTLGRLHDLAGRSEESATTLERAVGIYVADAETPAWVIAVARTHHGTALTHSGRFVDAEEQLRLAWDTLGPSDLVARRRKVIEAQVGLYEAWERPEDAAAWRARLE